MPGDDGAAGGWDEIGMVAGQRRPAVLRERRADHRQDDRDEEVADCFYWHCGHWTAKLSDAQGGGKSRARASVARRRPGPRFGRSRYTCRPNTSMLRLPGAIHAR